MSAPSCSRSPRKRIEGDKVCCTGSHGQEMLSAASQAADRFGYFFMSSTKTAGLLPFFPSAPPWYRQTQSSGSHFRFRFSSCVMALTPSWIMPKICEPMPRWPLNCADVTYAIISHEAEKIAHVSRRRVFPVSSRVIQEVRLLLD